jgi:hypothetical protein
MQRLTIGCDNCLSKNRVQAQGHEFAYECESCGFYSWLGQDYREDFALLNGLSTEEADDELRGGSVPFAFGSINNED